MTFQEAVKCYRSLLCKGILDELDNVSYDYLVWKRNPNPKNLDNLAKTCVIGNHQHRISSKAKKNAIVIIKNKLPIIFKSTFPTFEDLHKFVDGLIGGIHNIGLLTVYDVSLRIGHLFPNPIYPRKILYLNSGAMTGARKLLNGRILKPTELFVDFFSYLEAQSVVGIQNLQALPNCLVEDFLCVMHRYLDAGPRGLIQDRDTTTTYKKL